MNCCHDERQCADLARMEAAIQKHTNEVAAALRSQDAKFADFVCKFNGNLEKAISEYLLVLEKEGKLSELLTGTLYVLEKKTSHIINVKEYGAAGNGVCNDAIAVRDAIDHLEPGDTLHFPRGKYLLMGEIEIGQENITFEGEGLLLCDYGFRIKASNFKAAGLRMEGLEYSQDCRAFVIDNSEQYTDAPTTIENFVFKDCHFKNFFYAVSAIGGSYNYDGTEAAVGYPVRDLVIENCYSETYTDKNAGHFQCIQVENIAYLNNRTYGGTTASSYNAIKGNGFIRVIGNYDHNNAYASCEIENGSGNAVIANNTFNSKIWVDDSFDAVVSANVTKEGILITVGSGVGDAGNIVVSNNTCRNIRCERFGNYIGGLIKNVNIIGNIVNGDNTHGIWIHGNAVTAAKICNNFITGVNTNDIAIQRNEQLTCYTQGNFGNGKLMLIAGTGGKVFAVDNYNVSVSGNRDSLEVSHLERAFNGMKVMDTASVAWRINVNTSGEVYTTKY